MRAKSFFMVPLVFLIIIYFIYLVYECYKEKQRYEMNCMASNYNMFQILNDIYKADVEYKELYDYYKNQHINFLFKSPFHSPDLYYIGRGQDIVKKFENRELVSSEEFDFSYGYKYKYHSDTEIFELWDRDNPKLRAFMKKANEETLKNLKKNQKALDGGPYIIEYSYMP